MGSNIPNGIPDGKRCHKAGRLWGAALVCLLWAGTARAQSAPAPNATTPDIRERLSQLQDELGQARAELLASQRRIEQLSSQLESLRRDLGQRAGAPEANEQAFVSPADGSKAAVADPIEGTSLVEQLRENQSLLQAQIEEQHQTKVESASKYRVKLSGLILMNAYSNRGAVDRLDVPTRALNSSDAGSAGATLRQSLLGLQVFGPELAGARTSGNVSVDFLGGFPEEPYGATAGILRLREASAHLDWTNTSVTFGQEAPFITPLSPTSYATLAEPAFAWSGNLWVWTPQIFVERRFHVSDRSMFSISGGMLAPLTEEIPEYPQASIPNAGERARRPAFASRIGWESPVFGQKMRFGVGGYSGHLRYAFGRNTNSWAVTSYWQMPFGTHAELSGEAYRGMAVGGLGGGISQSIVYGGDPGIATTEFRPLNAVGGWAQLKFRLHPQWETNAAFGQDNVLARDLRWAPNLQGQYLTPLGRNRAAFGNVIFRPRSNLLLSVEYRKIWTYGYIGLPNSADQINLGAGVSF